MTKKFNLLGFVFFVLALNWGCQKSARRPEVSQRLVRGQSVYMHIVDDTVGLLNVNNSGFWGYVTAGTCLSPEAFSSQVRGLMSATLPENQIGLVSSYAGNQSGVRIQGGVRATFANGQLSNVDLVSAQLRLAIWDSLAGTTDSSGRIIPEYPIHLVGATGGVAGNNVNLTFSDTYGAITVNGLLQGGVIQGTVSFTNFVNVVNGSLPQSGLLGCFTISVCDFFVCN